MIKKNATGKSFFTLVAMIALLVVVLSGSAIGHGGKTHADENFTAFEALEKGVELYKRLLDSGKLEKGWKKDLESVEISHMKNDDGRAFRVSFHRTHGKPNAVYIFFKADGSYSGSNFTGE